MSTSTTTNGIPTTEPRKKIEARALKGGGDVGSAGRTPDDATRGDGGRSSRQARAAGGARRGGTRKCEGRARRGEGDESVGRKRITVVKGPG